MSVWHPRHATQPARAAVIAAPIGLLATALASLWVIGDAASDPAAQPEMSVPAAAAGLPPVDTSAVPVSDPCADPAVVAVLDSGADEAVIAAFGGADEFRGAVAAGNAPCISLSDPDRTWVVVNKLRPLEPVAYAPALAEATVPATTTAGSARPAVNDALADLVADAADARAGAIAVNNAYRSYALQERNYASFVAEYGQAWADAESARPGYSEHQTGLAVDIVACSPDCGGIQSFGGTPQATWVAENAWRYGFVVRYEEGYTRTTGYVSEPWHLRYVGTALAAAYHDGEHHSLEEFFGLPAAPDYARD